MDKKHAQSGFVMMGSLLMMTVLVTLSLAFFSRHYLFIQNTERNSNRIIALNLADTGVHAAIRGLELDEAYAGSAGYTAYGPKGGYNVAVSSLAWPADQDIRLIQSIGQAPSSTLTDRAYETRSVTAYVRLDTTPFQFAAFGDEGLTLNGTPLVDSYDSRDGVYGGMNVNANGDVATDQSFSFIGTPTVNGDQISNPKINCAPASTNLPSSGALRINGSQEYTLPAGTYHFDSINITGSGKLILSGPVTIYVSGEVYIGGRGVTTAGNDPTHFFLNATGNSTVEIAGSGAFYGAVYAPASPVTYTGTSDFFGAVIAKNYQQSGTSKLHYDEALSDISAPCIDVEVLSWRESGIAAQ